MLTEAFCKDGRDHMHRARMFRVHVSHDGPSRGSSCGGKSRWPQPQHDFGPDV